MASNTERQPSFLIQYYEYDKKIESSIELSKSPLVIDGLFDPNTKSKVSLGYYVNLRRRPETLDRLINIGIVKVYFKILV